MGMAPTRSKPAPTRTIGGVLGHTSRTSTIGEEIHLTKTYLADALDRNRQWLSMKNFARPLVGSWLGDVLQMDLYPKGVHSLGVGRIETESIRPRSFFEEFDHWNQAYQAVGDDLPFFIAAPFPGIPWMEAILGCPIYATEESIWSEPYLEDLSCTDSIETALEGPWFHKLIEFTRSAVEHAAGRYPVGMTLMRGPSDMLGALRGQAQLVYDLYDHAAETKRLGGICTDIWLKVADTQLRVLEEFHGGYATGTWGFKTWTPGLSLWFQEDASSFLSPRFYRELLLPLDERISQACKYTFIHLHSPTMYPLAELVTLPHLSGIEINVDTAGPKVEDLLPAFELVLEHKPLMISGYLDEDDVELILARLPYRGLCLQPVCATVEDGQRMFEKIVRTAARFRKG